MYAVIVTGGKQYKVQEGDIIYIEKLNAEADSEVVFDNVLALSNDDGLTFGDPSVNGASVSAKVIKNGKAKKVTIIKFKAKKNYRRKQGHRQPYTKVQIEKINA
ncbi:MAG: 50S ribosomal protein L21 [Bacillota bacterium]|nr:50S ribosomal protein L21 [Bacillota bacterium]